MLKEIHIMEVKKKQHYLYKIEFHLQIRKRNEKSCVKVVVSHCKSEANAEVQLYQSLCCIKNGSEKR